MILFAVRIKSSQVNAKGSINYIMSFKYVYIYSSFVCMNDDSIHFLILLDDKNLIKVIESVDFGLTNHVGQ